MPSAWSDPRRAQHETYPGAERRVLSTPPIARVTPAHVFDAFGWCPSARLEWRKPAGVWDEATPLDGADPTRMVFVFHDPSRDEGGAFLPSELARLHATGLGLQDEEALAPWGIDAATDGLYERRLRPSDVLWLAADNLNALFWGLHDWAHFHNHGAFDERAWTELQCDASALAWLWVNREEVRLADTVWERLRRDVVALTRTRFESEGRGDVVGEAVALLEAERVRGLVAGDAGSRSS